MSTIACPRTVRPSRPTHARQTPHKLTRISATLIRLAPGTSVEPFHACRPVSPASKLTSDQPMRDVSSASSASSGCAWCRGRRAASSASATRRASSKRSRRDGTTSSAFTIVRASVQTSVPECVAAWSGCPAAECLGTKEFGRRRRAASIITPMQRRQQPARPSKVLPTIEPPEPLVNCSPSTAVGALLPDVDGLATRELRSRPHLNWRPA